MFWKGYRRLWEDSYWTEDALRGFLSDGDHSGRVVRGSGKIHIELRML